MIRGLGSTLVTATYRFSLNSLQKRLRMASKTLNSERMTTADNLSYTVGHDRSNREFYIQIDDAINDPQRKAFLQYDYVSKDIVDIFHTEVPEAYRGKGIGKVLAKAALDHFVAEDWRMRLSCWYVRKYVNDNPVAQYTNQLVA